MTNVLVVEDDQLIAELERDFLEANNYTVYLVNNGKDALATMDKVDINAILLDIMLPGEDGYSLCRKMRAMTDVPIIFVTAKNDEVDTIRGLGLGADDFIAKPFSPTELIARLHAHLERYNRLSRKQTAKASDGNELIIGNLIIRPKARQVILSGKNVALTGKEFDLLYFEKIWSLDPVCEPATVTVHINRLRDKMKAATGRPFERIETVWGAGYRFHVD